MISRAILTSVALFLSFTSIVNADQAAPKKSSLTDEFLIGVAKSLHLRHRYADYAGDSRFFTIVESRESWEGKDTRVVFGYEMPLEGFLQ